MFHLIIGYEGQDLHKFPKSPRFLKLMEYDVLRVKVHVFYKRRMI